LYRGCLLNEGFKIHSISQGTINFARYIQFPNKVGFSGVLQPSMPSRGSNRSAVSKKRRYPACATEKERETGRAVFEMPRRPQEGVSLSGDRGAFHRFVASEAQRPRCERERKRERKRQRGERASPTPPMVIIEGGVVDPLSSCSLENKSDVARRRCPCASSHASVPFADAFGAGRGWKIRSMANSKISVVINDKPVPFPVCIARRRREDACASSKGKYRPSIGGCIARARFEQGQNSRVIAIRVNLTPGWQKREVQWCAKCIPREFGSAGGFRV